MNTLKLVFETEDWQFNVHRLVMFPELKVYARGVVKEASENAILLKDVNDMYELERRLFHDHYIIKTLKEIKEEETKGA